MKNEAKVKSESCILNTTSKQRKMIGSLPTNANRTRIAGYELNLLHVLFWALTVLTCYMGEMVLSTVVKNTMRMVLKRLDTKRHNTAWQNVKR